MKYSKKEAKEYAFQNMKGIWAAALNPLKDKNYAQNYKKERNKIPNIGLNGPIDRKSVV